MTDVTTNEKISDNKSYLAIVAIVVGVIAILFSTHVFYNNLKNTVALDKSLATLQNSVKQAAQPAPSMQGGLATVSYLIQLANMQLTLNHDPQAALKTAQLAQQLLSADNNANTVSLKQALASDITTLQSTSSVNIDTVFATLTTINQQIQQLSSIPTRANVSLEKTLQAARSTDTTLPWYKRIWESAKQVKTLFLVRRLDKQSSPLINADQEAIVKENMGMQLHMAQWALLNRDQKIFQTALQSVQAALTRYFALSDTSNPLVSQLQTLENTSIQPSLTAFTQSLQALAGINPSNTAQPAIIAPPTAQPPTTTTAPATPKTPAGIET